MAESKMNKTYWVAHKAKTLLDSGDTVAKALEMWDKDKAKSSQNWNPDLMATVLLNISMKAGALDAKANSTIHKETKALLKFYKEQAKFFSDAIKAATGKELVSHVENLTLPDTIAQDLKATDPSGWAQFDENYSFLKAMKKSNNKGSQTLYDGFIKDNSPKQVNISSELRTKLDNDAKAKKWDSDNWEAAKAEIHKVFSDNVKGKVGPLMAKIDKKHKIALAKAL
ncbi:MAG: hypothetical protein ABIQ99_05295 [Thermoflexales bacterium]